jgi:ketosteroid isomerase-like protein
MHIATALGAGLLLAAGMASANAGDTDAALTRYVEALNAHMPPHPEDGAAIARFFAEDAVHQDMFRWPPPEPQRGRAEIAAFFDGFDERWADYRHVERRRVVSGNDAVWEGTGRGTWKATGKPVEFPMVMSLEFNDAGEIAASRVYLDPGRVQAQAR